ncbi:substrate-binding domain-containing protein [Calidifontibacter sp. DB0510]|uniref:Substrate-binding domain-containing protein n=2 Tax=Metallococcus carri TaxID=1656884 RepID=A0A967AYU4_9MICO|nr:substrate-binding domain-containing protein [Metallococcus carri]NOP36922.1 substrate-binding domain-containing protein [Calidifontibacter sp. DB2511S]
MVGLTACSHGSNSSSAPKTNAAGGSCSSVVKSARAAVDKASAKDTPWAGPTTGPAAVSGKSIVYVAADMTNPGVAGAASGVTAAAKAIGWRVRVIDGKGTPAGTQSAFSQALALRPDGIMIGGFDPNSTSAQVAQANQANIPLVGWQALATPGPSTSPKLFSNVTTKVADVAKITADWIIAESNGTAGVVVFTDKSIPFAAGKSAMIEKELKTCSSIKLLSTQNIPLADVSNRMPAAVSSLVSKYGQKWNYSTAINDVYFENAAAPLRAAGVKAGDIVNIGAGDGDTSALQRIRSGNYQAASVPSPLVSEGWQMIDEMNRALNNAPASGYVPAVHVSTKANLGPANSWNPSGYEAAYKKIWKR